jgi:hypothetical protein
MVPEQPACNTTVSTGSTAGMNDWTRTAGTRPGTMGSGVTRTRASFTGLSPETIFAVTQAPSIACPGSV